MAAAPKAKKAAKPNARKEMIAKLLAVKAPPAELPTPAVKPEPLTLPQIIGMCVQAKLVAATKVEKIMGLVRDEKARRQAVADATSYAQPRTIQEAIVALRAAKDAKEEAEAALGEINKRIQRLEMGDLPELLEASGLDQAKEDGAGSVTLDVRVNAYVKAEAREGFFTWLRANQEGDLIKESVHDKTLQSWAKERLADGKELPEQVSTSPRIVAKFRKG